MRFKVLIFFIIIAYANNATLAQDSYFKYYIELSDKEFNEYNINNPNEFLSNRAIQRRINQNIQINHSDLPVSKYYVDSLLSFGIKIIHTSKWFNIITVKITDESVLNEIENLSFVNNFRRISEHLEDNKLEPIVINDSFRDGIIVSNKSNYYDYGQGDFQISIHNGNYLHNNGFRGQGVMIAVTDSGFENLNNMSSIDSLLNSNRIIATRNFVDGGDDVYYYHDHGSMVLSVIASNHPGMLVGSAPEADYLLLITEDAYSETFIEELNWVVAAEFADSIGADIINVSLGYLKYDDSEFDYTYEDMDGETAIISRAANLAYQKGMIVVAAAGNSGDSQSHPFISSPGDTDGILTVGSVNNTLEISSFSSTGPSFDGRIKPDVVALGSSTFIQRTNGEFSYGSGTSFATPIVSGLVACLWQRYPEKTNYEIMQIVRAASSKYSNPDYFFGYGIPDFQYASILLEKKDFELVNQIEIFPNPFHEYLTIVFPEYFFDTKTRVTISDISGRIIYEMPHYPEIFNNKLEISGFGTVSNGIYFIRISNSSNSYSQKVLKY